jgi:hypothetical protein
MARRSKISVIRRSVLEHASRALLAKYLAPWSSFFATHDVSLAALVESPQSDHALPWRMYALLKDERTAVAPAELSEALTALDMLASDEGRGELVKFDFDEKLPRGRLSNEDLALTALLEQPDVATLARLAARPVTESAFAEYVPATKPSIKRFNDATMEELRARIAKTLASLDHAAYCAIRWLPNDAGIEIEIDHGSRPRARDIIDLESLETKHVTDATVRRAYVAYHEKSGRLSIRALATVRDLIRRSLGDILGGEPELFRAEGLYDLTPLKDLDALLAPEGVLKSIEIRQLVVITPNGTKLDSSRGQHLLADECEGEIVRAHARIGRPVGAKLYLEHEQRSRPIRVEIHANDHRNTIDYDRRNPTIARFVERFLRSRKILLDMRTEESSSLESEGLSA